MEHASKWAALDMVRILSYALDDMHDLSKLVESITERHIERIDRIGARTTDTKAIHLLLKEMPPERASALVRALTDLGKFASTHEKEMEERAAQNKREVEFLEGVRANLHIALGDK